MFQPYLQRFVVAFFDDILIYSKTLDDHLLHLTIVLETLAAHTLFAKRSKCRFGCIEIEYLGHLVLAEGVKTDPTKI